RSYEGKPFDRLRVREIRLSHGLIDRFSRLRAAGMLTLTEIAARLDVCPDTVKVWHRRGLLAAHRYSDKSEYLFEPPTGSAPAKWKRKTARDGDAHASQE